MENSQSKEERERATSETPLDAVDHGRLARLVTPRLTTAVDEEQSLRDVQVSTGSMPTVMPQTVAPQRAASPTSFEAATISPPLAAQKKSFPTALIVIFLMVIAALLIGIAVYFLIKSKAPTEPATPTTQQPEANKPPDPNAPIKPDMVSLPGGTFQMGRSDGADQEGPPRSVTVGAFSIDRTEVTNAEYAQFVKEMGYSQPRHFSYNRPIKGQEQWPVTNVSLEDAKAFAAWRSKRDGVSYRLPTEEEWEYAARDSAQGTIFPWGNAWAEGKANVNTASLKPVGSFPEDKTSAGAVDMIGNAYEWTTSRASYYPGNKEQLKAEYQNWVVVRGGAYITNSSNKQISATYRDWIPPTTQNSGLGFRLVRSQ